MTTTHQLVGERSDVLLDAAEVGPVEIRDEQDPERFDGASYASVAGERMARKQRSSAGQPPADVDHQIGSGL